MKTIELTRGYRAMVDDADFDWLSQWRWKSMTVGKHLYAARIARKGEEHAGRLVLMHRSLLALPPGRAPVVDHRNGLGLDNRRSNLRACSSSQNNAHARRKGNRHGFKGVLYDAHRDRYRAEIYFEGNRRRSRRFKTAMEAAAAYDALAVELHGEFALTNFEGGGGSAFLRPQGRGPGAQISKNAGRFRPSRGGGR